MDTGLARVLSTSILVIGILIVVFATGTTDKNYATVNFDGGYSKIGVIYSERVESEAELTFNGDIIVEGDINDAISYIQNNLNEGDVFFEGVSLTATTSIKWIASRQDFTLSTDNYSIVSDGKLNAYEQITVLEKMLSDAKLGRESTSLSSLSFIKDPNAGLIGQLTSLLK
ncbi:hypothetical protein N8985_04525 [Glaciecola sp.]|jgi:hypothetical protein|nr:hypothetical protein [Glaciecola sp.]